MAPSPIFVLEMCKRQDETDQQEVLVVVATVAQILTHYHDPFLH